MRYADDDDDPSIWTVDSGDASKKSGDDSSVVPMRSVGFTGSGGGGGNEVIVRNVTSRVAKSPLVNFELLGAAEQLYPNERASTPDDDPVVDWCLLRGRNDVSVLLKLDGAARHVEGVPREIARKLASGDGISNAYLISAQRDVTGAIRVANARVGDLYGPCLLRLFFLQQQPTTSGRS